MFSFPLPSFLRRKPRPRRRPGDPALRRDRQRRARRAWPEPRRPGGCAGCGLRAQAGAGGGAPDQQPRRLAGPVGADRRAGSGRWRTRRGCRCWRSSRMSRHPAAIGSPVPPTRSSPIPPRSWARSAWSPPASASRRRSPGWASSGAFTPPARARRCSTRSGPSGPDDLDLLREHPGRHPGALRRACARPARRPAQGRGCRAVRRPRLDRRCGRSSRG